MESSSPDVKAVNYRTEIPLTTRHLPPGECFGRDGWPATSQKRPRVARGVKPMRARVCPPRGTEKAAGNMVFETTVRKALREVRRATNRAAGQSASRSAAPHPDRR